MVWAAQYRLWGGLKHLWRADNDNRPAASPSPAHLMRGALALKYDSLPEQRAHEAVLDCPIRFRASVAIIGLLLCSIYLFCRNF